MSSTAAQERPAFSKRLLDRCCERPYFVFALFFCFYFGFVIGSAPKRLELESHLVTGDGFYYFCWAHSLLFDRDVNFRNQYEEFGAVCMGKTYLPLSGDQVSGPESVEPGRLIPSTPYPSKVPAPFGPWNGEFPEYPGNTGAIGSAFLWIPFLALAHLVTLALRALGVAGFPADGYSLIYQCAVAAGSNFWVFLGCCFLFKAASEDFGRCVSFLAVMFVITASALVNYLVYQVAYGHTQEFFIGSLLLFLLLRYRSFEGMTHLNAVMVGALVGFAAMVRWPAAAWGLVPVGLWLRDMIARPRKARTLVKGLLFAAGVVIAFLPQILAWKAIYGRYFASFPEVHWAAPFPVLRLKEMLLILVSNNHGLFFWHPVLLPGFLGVFLGLSPRLNVDQGRRYVIAFSLLVFLAFVYLNSMVFDWWCGSAFGMRRMIGVYPLLAWGLAAFLTRSGLAARQPLVVLAGWLLLSAWNAVLLFIWIFHLGGGVFPH